MGASRKRTPLMMTLERFALSAIDKPDHRFSGNTVDASTDVLGDAKWRELAGHYGRCGFVLLNGGSFSLLYSVTAVLARAPLSTFVTLLEETELTAGSNTGVLELSPFARELRFNVRAFSAGSQTSYELQMCWTP